MRWAYSNIVGASLARRQPAAGAIIGLAVLALAFTGTRLAAKPPLSTEFYSLAPPASSGVCLLGVGLDQPRAGILGVTLYWQALQRLDDLETFVALVDGQGNASGNPMRKPLEWAYLSSEWQVGEIIADRVEVEQQSNIGVSGLRVSAGLRPFHDQSRRNRTSTTKAARALGPPLLGIC